MYKFDVSPVYYANYNATEQVVINQGGTDSGKTYAIMQLLFTIATTNKAPTEDPIITVVGESVPNLKKGAYRVAKNIYNSNEGLKKYVKNWNETDRMIYFKSGWIIEFTSYENEQGAKQGKRQYSFFNEANGITWGIFWQVAKRTRVRTFVDYNPSAPFWAHDKLIGTDKETNDIGADVKLIISDHRHNPFLSEEEHRRTESIKDKDLWRVYARGLTGNLEGIIYNDWQVIDYNDFPHQNDFIGGLDFGYTNDPTAGVKIVRIGESIFVHEICYTPGIAPIQMKQIFEANGFTSSTPIYCDHDPDQIAQLRRLGMRNCLPARKGQGSINAGIIRLKEFKVFYTSNSLNLHEERQKYMWAKDNKTGQSTNTPIDTFNHLMDSIRYGVYTHYFKK
jgi:phage terminase large subunit